MGLIKFEITENHLKLLKQLRFHSMGDHLKSGTREVDELDGTASPYGGDSLEDDMGLIVYGPPENFDPMESEGFEWTQEQLDELRELHEGMPTALDISLSMGEFKVGHYKRKSYERNWEGFEPK